MRSPTVDVADDITIHALVEVDRHQTLLLHENIMRANDDFPYVSA